jgi:hypothetical protein
MKLDLRTGTLALALGLLGTALGACGDTLQDQPVATSLLEKLIMVRPFPVYWLGTRFDGLPVAGVTEDPGGAYMIQYGDCSVGGQYTCVSPVEIITNPDNSFRPGAGARSSVVVVRGASGVLTRGGDAITIPTGGVVVDIYARTPALARAAVTDMTPINWISPPGGPLPRALPNTGFAGVPLRSQLPPLPDAPPATLER